MNCPIAQTIRSASELTRKQRELLQREELILDTAQKILHEHGYAHLTMDKLAEAVEYSKGTLYNHFSSKEDLLCSLCCRCVTSLIELFERAFNYEGTTRERFSAIGVAYSLYYQLHPMDAQNLQTIRVNHIREKLSDEKIADMESLEQKIVIINLDLVTEAITNGDLAENDHPIADSIVFGCWSMNYGALLLDQSDVPLTELGFSPRAKMTWSNTQKLLDGFNWKPLSTETNTDTLFEKLCNELFSEEINALILQGEM